MNRFEIVFNERGSERDRAELRRRLWSLYWPKGDSILRKVFRLSNEDAEDLLQEVFAVVFARLGCYNPLYSFSTWFYRILRNKALDAVRRGKRRLGEGTPEEAEAAASNEAGPETAYEKKETQVWLRDYIACLPEETCLLIWLRYRDDLRLGDIARITDLPLGTVKYRFNEIRGRLREAYGKEFGHEG